MAPGVGHREEGVREHEDERVHVRVNFAEDAHDPGPVETNGLGPAGGVAAEIKAPDLRQREDIVVDAIAVRELDRGASRDRQHVRHERLVSLIHDGPGGFGLFERTPRRCLEIHD